MPGTSTPDHSPSVVLGRFLQVQAKEAGLSAREITQRFKERVEEELNRPSQSQGRTVTSTNELRFSKSHLDRLFKGTASLPPKEFIRIYLEITSAAAGLSPERHKQAVTKGETLLLEAHRSRRSPSPSNPFKPTQESAEHAVATLQVRLELERTLHIESRLRWALGDAQFLVTTLMQIIGALRNIIQDLDASSIRDPHRYGSIEEHQREEAFSQKRSAELQLSLASERRTLLESLWDQAHANIHRLSSHPDVADIPLLPDAPVMPQQPLLAVHTESTLTDIATALDKVQEVNGLEGRQAREWQQELTSNGQLNEDAELRTLVACTRLADSDTRRTALRALVRSWPDEQETRDALIRMTKDENNDIQDFATGSLIELWPEDSNSLNAVVEVAIDGRPVVQLIAISGLANKWRGNVVARDTLVDLTQADSKFTREIAAQGLGIGWPGDGAARGALLRLAMDEHSWLTALESLHDGWPDDVGLRAALVILSRSSNAAVRSTSADMLGRGWSKDPEATAALLSLISDPTPTVRWFAERALVSHGITDVPAQPIPDAVDRSSGPALIAARLPREFASRRPLKVIDELHRGIHFDSPITAVIGDNSTGKTMLLETLAESLGISNSSRRGSERLTYTTPLKLRLVDQIELLWRDKPEPQQCKYTRPGFRLTDKEEIYANLAAWARDFRMVLVDEFDASMSAAEIDRLFKRARGIAIHNGCQFILATTHGSHMIPEGVNVVHLGRHRRRLPS
ncbi:hypothetical protein [Streptomyces lateritius]|uniref:hypothetical protein n=1 Tax=Streptomyces lateritius TaxID=67313 RepID=UPI001C8CD72D|nr:hypothetical protein [Streptomyces lateritius]MBX9423525.1 hypothetical protein [Streptomyces lateritius]